MIRRVGVIEERLNAPSSQPGMTPFCMEHKEAIEKLSTHVESVETKVNTKIEELQRKVWGWSATLGAMIVVASIAIPLVLHFLPKKGP